MESEDKPWLKLPICHPILEKGEGTMEELREVMSEEDIESLIIQGFISIIIPPFPYWPPPAKKKKSLWKRIWESLW